MTMRERLTAAVLPVLIGAAAWFAWRLRAAGGLDASAGTDIAIAAVAIGLLTALLGGVVAATAGKRRRVDERDHRIALRAQVFRGSLYLSLSFGLLGLALASENYALMNGLFLAILGIEIVSGAAMLVLYRLPA